MNRFAICEAYFAFMVDWQGGRDGDFGISVRLHNIQFSPRPSLGGFDTLDAENDYEAIDTYHNLLDQYGFTAEFNRQQKGESQ